MLVNNPLGEVYLIRTRDIIEFVSLIKEIEFGDRFSLSMLHWCGIGKREYPLKFWEVYIAKIDNETVGVIGLYQQMETKTESVWVGWFGVRPQFRRKGIGTTLINQLKKIAADYKFRELLVFTDQDNVAALSLYQNNGFIKVEPSEAVSLGKTHDPSDIVLKLGL